MPSFLSGQGLLRAGGDILSKSQAAVSCWTLELLLRLCTAVTPRHSLSSFCKAVSDCLTEAADGQKGLILVMVAGHHGKEGLESAHGG